MTVTAKSKDKKIRMLGIVIVFIALAGAIAGGQPLQAVEGKGTGGEMVVMNENVTAQGTANEGDPAAVPFKIVDAKDAGYSIDKVTKVSFKLTWEDTAAKGRLGFGRWYTNTPDELTLTVKPPMEGMEPSSDTGVNAQGGSGEVTITFTADQGIYWDVRELDWTVTIDADCGDEEPRGVGLMPSVADTSTEWNMEITYSFEVPEGSAAGGK